VIFSEDMISVRGDPSYCNYPGSQPSHLATPHTYLLTYLLTPWYRVLLEKVTGLQLVKKFAAFYGT